MSCTFISISSTPSSSSTATADGTEFTAVFPLFLVWANTLVLSEGPGVNSFNAAFISSSQGPTYTLIGRKSNYRIAQRRKKGTDFDWTNEIDSLFPAWLYPSGKWKLVIVLCPLFFQCKVVFGLCDVYNCGLHLGKAVALLLCTTW